MRIVHGVYNGTGLDMYLCIGFIPDWIIFHDLTTGATAVGNWYKWSPLMNVVATAQQGIGHNGSDSSAGVDYALGEGIRAYYGGDIATSTIQSATANGEAPVLVWDHKDYRYNVNHTGGHGAGEAASDDIISWTLDTASTAKGHWNEDVKASPAYIGAGSPIHIDGKRYFISAVSSGQGESSSEVTLSYAVPSGDVQFIGNKYSLKPITVGDTMPAGVWMDATCVPAVDDNICYFMAGSAVHGQ